MLNPNPSKKQLETRTFICLSALECVKRFGFDRVTMSDIAKEAEIARPTLYKYYKNKEEVLFAAIDMEALKFAESVVKHAQKFTSLEERVVETIIFVVEKLPKHPYLSLILKDELAKAFRERAFSDEATLIFSELTAKPLIEIKPQLKEQGVEISEIMSRFAISMVMFPGKYAKDKEGLRALIKRRVLPGLI